MFPPEAIEVLERTDSRLIILDPPYYSFGAWVLFLGATSLAIGIVLLVRHAIPPLAWMLSGLSVLLFLFGSYLFTNKTSITLSRNDGMLTVQNAFWGINRPQSTLPLTDIRRATVETLKYARTIIVVMKSGQSFALANGSNRDGYYGAADAINSFLGVPTTQ
jgi:cobalamin biosynthesis protein CobD/CbiB